MKSELFLIEVLCEETGEWVEMETSTNPYPMKGSDADELVKAGCLYRWTATTKRWMR